MGSNSNYARVCVIFPWEVASCPYITDVTRSPSVTKVNKFYLYPLLLSAGIGRTGTYIAVDYLKKQAAEEGIIDILSCVDRMREDRINMVQSLVGDKKYYCYYGLMLLFLI